LFCYIGREYDVSRGASGRYQRKEVIVQRTFWFLLCIVLSAVPAFVLEASGDQPEQAAIPFGGGGTTVGLFFPDFDNVNGFLYDHGFARLDEILVVAGGSGRGGVIGDLTVGGAGWGGWVESSRDERVASLSVGFGGFDVGYAAGGAGRSVLTIGAVLGGGGGSLELFGVAPENGPEKDAERLPAGIVIELTGLEYNTAFVGLQPYVDMQAQLSDWLGVGVRIGYLLTPFEFSWGDAEIALYSPDLNLSGPFIGFSIVFGGIGEEREPESLADRLQRIVERAVDRHKPGYPGALLYVSAPELGVWSGAAGMANVETGEAMRPDSKFGIGSITKTFVSVVVLQLVEEGILSLDDTLSKVLPVQTAGKFAGSDRITVRMLLNHTSGIPEWVNQTTHEAVAADPSTVWDVETVLDLAATQAPYFPPGEGYMYSNTDYTLLGMIIEQVTGRSWREEVRSRILDPLGMDDTAVRDPGDISMPDGHAHGYADIGSGVVDVTYADPSMAGAAGGNAIISTAADLARFIDALLAGVLLQNPVTLAEMMTFVDAPDEHGMIYWYGLGLEKYIFPGGITAIGHAGGAVGYGSVMYRAPDHDITIVGLGNFFDLAPAYVDLLMPALQELMK